MSKDSKNVEFRDIYELIDRQNVIMKNDYYDLKDKLDDIESRLLTLESGLRMPNPARIRIEVRYFSSQCSVLNRRIEFW